MATAVSPSQQQQESLSPQQLMQIASMDNAIRETDPQVLRIAAQVSRNYVNHLELTTTPTSFRG
jgi:hypothetical protein